MITKEEILKMSKKEMDEYMHSLVTKETNIDCSECSRCTSCIACNFCFSCCFCSGLYYGRYMICNVQLTKEEYNAKMKELEENESVKV